MKDTKDTVGRSRARPAAGRRFRESLWAMLAAALVIALMRTAVFMSFYISSGSMQPALERGDFVLVNQFVYRLHPPRRGDVIVFQYPQHEGWDFVKRVVGLPGDLVAARDGRLWVNEMPVSEPEVLRVADGVGPSLGVGGGRVPSRQLFVLGDNRGASLDSRFWGTVDERNVIGKAFLIYWSQGEHWWNVRWERIGKWLP